MDGTHVDRFWPATRVPMHPNATGHALIHDFISLKVLQNLGCDARQLWLSSPSQLASLDYCTQPASLYSAFAPPDKGVRAVAWTLQEDRPGKPGWIAQSNRAFIDRV